MLKCAAAFFLCCLQCTHVPYLQQQQHLQARPFLRPCATEPRVVQILQRPAIRSCTWWAINTHHNLIARFDLRLQVLQVMQTYHFEHNALL